MYNSSLTTQPATTGFDQIEWWNNLPDVWKKIFTAHLYHFDEIKMKKVMGI